MSPNPPAVTHRLRAVFLCLLFSMAIVIGAAVKAAAQDGPVYVNCYPTEDYLEHRRDIARLNPNLVDHWALDGTAIMQYIETAYPGLELREDADMPGCELFEFTDGSAALWSIDDEIACVFLSTPQQHSRGKLRSMGRPI